MEPGLFDSLFVCRRAAVILTCGPVIVEIDASPSIDEGGARKRVFPDVVSGYLFKVTHLISSGELAPRQMSRGQSDSVHLGYELVVVRVHKQDIIVSHLAVVYEELLPFVLAAGCIEDTFL